MDQSEVYLSGPYGRERGTLWQLAKVKGLHPIEADERAYTESDDPIMIMQGAGPIVGFWPILNCLEHRHPAPRLQPIDVPTRASAESLLHLLLNQDDDLRVLSDLSKYWRSTMPGHFLMGEHPTVVDLLVLHLAGGHHVQLFPNLRRRLVNVLGDSHETR